MAADARRGVLEVPENFAGRLRYALKTINMPPAALGATVGVDKSVVSRWLSGKTLPSEHNLARISTAISRQRPGFSSLAFEADGRAFLRALGEQGLDQHDPPARRGALSFPFGLLDDARHEVARRGMEYYGRYDMHYWSFSRPGLVVRMHLMLRPRDGLIEALYGADGFEFEGWALLLLNRLYMPLAEERFEAMAFLITNAGQQPKAELIRGLLMGPSEGLLVPTVSPVVLTRTAELSGDEARDEAAYREAKAFDPLAEGAKAPESVRRLLSEDCVVPAGPAGAPVQLRAPYRGPGE